VPVRQWLQDRARRRLAARFVAGDGLEIGALHRPFPVPEGARVRYVDRVPADTLREDHPELAGELVEVGLVDDAQELAGVADGTQDFVIAAHVLEHLEDPLGALEHWLAVLRPGGVLVLVAGDRRRGLDARRAAPTLDHLRADHADGGAGSRSDHYREWAELVDAPLGFVSVQDAPAHAKALERGGHPIHFHCWTRAELRALVDAGGLPAAVIAERQAGDEFALVLSRGR
jgi:SAM-dependent methyltransferase